MGAPTQGDQSGMDMRDRYRLGIQGMEEYAQQLYQKGFAQLAPTSRTAILTDMQAGIPDTFDGNSIQAAATQPVGYRHRDAPADGAWRAWSRRAAFFNLLLSHTLAGFFADPVHGGNRDMVGWKLIGFPGAQMSYANEISKYGVPFTGPFKSLAEYQGQFDTGA